MNGVPWYIWLALTVACGWGAIAAVIITELLLAANEAHQRERVFISQVRGLRHQAAQLRKWSD